MSGICDTCRREPCHMRFDGCKTCDVYEGGESNYTRLFGTPERAARTLHHGGTLICRECLIREQCAETPEDSKCMILHYDALLEWLRGEDEVIDEPDTIRNELMDSGLLRGDA